jgi:hypothetical protein
MSDLIDLSLLKESRALLESTVKRRGLTYFLAKEGQSPLFSIEKSQVDMVVRTARARLERNGRQTHPKAVEYCQKELRRELIRRVTQAMMRVGY